MKDDNNLDFWNEVDISSITNRIGLEDGFKMTEFDADRSTATSKYFFVQKGEATKERVVLRVPTVRVTPVTEYEITVEQTPTDDNDVPTEDVPIEDVMVSASAPTTSRASRRDRRARR